VVEKEYPEAAVERAMKVQEVIMRAMAKRITWWEAAEILGIHVRTMRRWRARLKRDGYSGLFDRRRHPSPKRVAVEEAEQVLGLYQEKYSDFNVRHFHEKLSSVHGIGLSYTWVKRALQAAGLVKTARRRGPYRKRRPRRPLPGMMLHIDASRHQWFSDERWHDLIVVLDDATSEIYYAQLVAEESTRTVMAAFRSVVEKKGWFSSVYSDRASHFFRTPKAGQPVDTRDVTEVGRALKELGIRMIPAYSPQARGRSERSFGTWQGRLPQELRLKNIGTPEEANAFLNDYYIREFNGKFTVPAAERGTAFAPIYRQDLDRVFAIQQERVVDNDNTIQFANHVWQIPPTPFRATLAGCRVLVYEHMNGTFSVGYGPHTVARFTAEGEPVSLPKAAVRKSSPNRSPKPRWRPAGVHHTTAVLGSRDGFVRVKTGRGMGRTQPRTRPITDPGARILNKNSVKPERTRKPLPPARPARRGASASATPQNASPYGLRWGFAPADAPLRARKETKETKKRTQAQKAKK
jgi:transposase